MNPSRLLSRSPQWLKNFVDDIAQGRGVLGMAADRVRYSFSSDQIPRVPAAPATPVRLLVGPANEAEQGYQWARAVERYLPGVGAISMMGFDPGGYQVKADLTATAPVYLRATDFHRALEGLVAESSHVIIESGLPLLGRKYRTDASREVRHFREHGAQVAMLFHGSDLRLPSQHRREHARSPFTSPNVPSEILEEKAKRNAARATELGLPAFVSTPDLLRYLPQATWCPVVVDVDEWAAVPRAEAASPPLVLHAPSNPWIKGSHLVEPVVRALEAEGLIRYRRIEGLRHDEMPQQYAQADIVLDQFLIGSYGVAACEALASGCRVVGHIDQPTRQAVHDITGLDVPIVEATVDTLDAVLRAMVAASGEEIAARRSAGVEFVREVHDGRQSAEALRGFLGV